MKRILATAVAVAMASAASAQTVTTGGSGTSSTTTTSTTTTTTVSPEVRTKVREYVVKQKPKSAAVPSGFTIVRGATLPETTDLEFSSRYGRARLPLRRYGWPHGAGVSTPV